MDLDNLYLPNCCLRCLNPFLDLAQERAECCAVKCSAFTENQCLTPIFSFRRSSPSICIAYHYTTNWAPYKCLKVSKGVNKEQNAIIQASTREYENQKKIHVCRNYLRANSIQVRNSLLTEMAEASAFPLFKMRINLALVSRRNMVLMGRLMQCVISN